MDLGQKNYVIAGILLNLDSSVYIEECWKKFSIAYNLDDIEELQNKIQILEEDPINYHGIRHTKLKQNDSFILETDNEFAIVNTDWTIGRILTQNALGRNALLMQIFYTNALQYHMLQFHSSIIRLSDGKGLMFLGPSGIGKTTQAELWNRYRDALIINGDIVFVQETPEAFLGWGTPWHGSSPYCENTSVPLKAMIVLKQSPENSIRELTGFEKVTAVSNNVFYPTWLENGMELCLETLDHLLSRIPVYELSCRPDEEAVKLTEETIFGSSSVSD